MSGFNTHEGRMTRRVVDCFTTDALRQIQSAVNGEEYVNEYRGGMGSDIRYLSDFAVEQIKNAVTVNGGGGGTSDSPIVRSVWYQRDNTEDEPTKATIAYGEAHIDYSADLFVYLSSEDELSYESLIGVWSANLRCMFDGLQINITTEHSVDFGNHLTLEIQSNSPRLSVVVDNYVRPFTDAIFKSVWACDYSGENAVKLQAINDFNSQKYSTPLSQDGGYIVASRSDYFTSPLTQNSDFLFSIDSSDGQLYASLDSNEALRFYRCNYSHGVDKFHIYDLLYRNSTIEFYFYSENQN